APGRPRVFKYNPPGGEKAGASGTDPASPRAAPVLFCLRSPRARHYPLRCTPNDGGPMPMTTDEPWDDARRIEAWAGEVRVHVIRFAALLAFYGHHLVNVNLLADDPSLSGSYHAAVTVVVLAWAAEGVALHLCLSRRWVPPALKYVATGVDTLLVTAVLV